MSSPFGNDGEGSASKVRVEHHGLVRQALHQGDLTVEHPFRATRLTLGRTILDIDDERHPVIKRIVSRMFSVEAVETYRRRIIAPTVTAICEGLAGRNTVDIVTELAIPLPTRVIFAILGLPMDLAVDVYHRDMKPVVSFIGDNRSGLGAAQSGHTRLVQLVDQEIAARTERDVATLWKLVEDGVENGATRDEMVSAIVLLMLAGTETTICALSNLFFFIGEYPLSWHDVCAGRLSDRTFAEEVLRIEAPIHHTHRFATSDVELTPECRMSRGDVVEVCLGKANRTEDRLVAPDAWSPCEGRGIGTTFGAGRHACIGKGLAIAEMLEVIAQMKRRGVRASAVVRREPISGVTFRSSKQVIMSGW